MAFNPHIPRKHLFLYPLFFSYILSLFLSLLQAFILYYNRH